ncbi:hypothetical protein EQ875_01615 [Photobacterium damselae subsp. damselae]|uniref:hypothetical protein n=1 Tax=Photobacterium damselae TaxID=38293 RepID=UPI00109B73C1|nr:hypothetical protein [Photobacterium damselae]TGZ35334.1 hypothetical protein EQ875_01615 [Photobacterium damselae subsp. damselae]
MTKVTDLRNTIIFKNTPAIQQALFEHGATWNHGSTLVSHNEATCLLIDSNNKIFFINNDEISRIHNKREIFYKDGYFYNGKSTSTATEISDIINRGDYFVMLTTQNGGYTPLMLCTGIELGETELAKFTSKNDAETAANNSILGAEFGFEVFEIGYGV